MRGFRWAMEADVTNRSSPLAALPWNLRHHITLDVGVKLASPIEGRPMSSTVGSSSKMKKGVEKELVSVMVNRRSGKGEEPGEIREARTEHRGVISSRTGVHGKGNEVYTETPKPSYAEAVIAVASGRGLVRAEILSPVHNPGAPLGNDRETTRGFRANDVFLPKLIPRAPVGEVGSHPGYSYGEPGGLHEGFRVAMGGSITTNHAQERGRNLDAELCVEVNRANFEEAELMGRVDETAKETGSENSNFSKEKKITPRVPDNDDEEHTDVEVMAETAKKPGSENSNIIKKEETSPLVSDKEEEGHIDSRESGQAANMEISEGSQGYNQAITNMESLAAAVQSEAIKVLSEENQIGEEPLSQQPKLGKEILYEVVPQPQPLGNYQEDTNSFSEEEDGCHPLSPPLPADDWWM
ncbi:hypothetical protein U1Q18_000075 [Sarracenia purpurea var. burkii]